MLVAQYNIAALHPDVKQFDARRHFLANLPSYLDLAAMAVAQADSYRVKVGGAYVAINPTTNMVGTFVNWNDKPFMHLRKRCYEMKSMEESRDGGYTKPVGSVAHGPNDIDVIESITGHRTPTLHYCDDCLQTADNYIREGELEVSEHDVAVTTGGPNGATEVNTIGDMLARRNGTYVERPAHQNVHSMIRQGGWPTVLDNYVALGAIANRDQRYEADLINAALQSAA